MYWPLIYSTCYGSCTYSINNTLFERNRASKSAGYTLPNSIMFVFQCILIKKLRFINKTFITKLFTYSIICSLVAS